MSRRSRAKVITVSLPIQEIVHDNHFFNVPGELSDPQAIKNAVLKKYQTDLGIIEAVVDNENIHLQWYPDSYNEKAEVLNIQAIELIKVKRIDEAIEKWEEALTLNPTDVEYLFKLGILYFEQKNFSESIQYLSKAIEICPIHFRAHLTLGINWIKLRKFEKAEVHITESNRLNRKDKLTYLNLGAIYSIQKRFNEAIEMFNATLNLDPDESRAHLGLARIYSLLNDLDSANSHYKKVIEISPETRLAEYAKRSIQTPEIIETVQETAKVSKEQNLGQGIGYYLSGHYRKSSQEYKAYLKAKPSDDYAWYLLGESTLRMGDLENSANCFKRAIRLNSKRGLYFKSLGITLYLLGKSPESVEVLKTAVEMGKNDPLCLTLYGVNLMRLKKMGEAVKNLKNALKRDPNNPLAMYNLALAYIQQKEKNQAVNLLEKITSLEYFAPIKKQAKNLLFNLST